MPRRRNPIIRWLVATVAIAYVKVTGLLPLSIARAIGRLAGRLAYHLAWQSRARGMDNMNLVYQDTMSGSEKVQMLKKAAESLGVMASEFGWIPRLRGEFLERQVQWLGFDYIDPSQGCIVIGAHLGNWEWMGPAIRARGRRMAEIVRPLDEPRLNRFIDRTRSAGDVVTIEKEGAGPKVVSMLRKGWIIGILVDQHARKNAIPARFFGQPCGATIAPAILAMRASVPVHTLRMARNPAGSYTFEFSPPIEMVHTGNFREDVAENTQRFQDAVEGLVRRYPEQWLWFHHRWKLRERLERERSDGRGRG